MAALGGPALALAAPSPLDVLTATGRREVSTVIRDGAELVAIEDVAVGFGLTVTRDAGGTGATLVVGEHRELGLYDGKSLASVDGDLRLLSAAGAATRTTAGWFPSTGSRGSWVRCSDSAVDVEARPAGARARPVRYPAITVRTFASGDVRPRRLGREREACPFRVEQAEDRITVAIARDLVDVAAFPERLTGGHRRVGGVRGREGQHVRRPARAAASAGQGQRAGVARRSLVLDLRGEPGSTSGPAPSDRGSGAAAAGAGSGAGRHPHRGHRPRPRRRATWARWAPGGPSRRTSSSPSLAACGTSWSNNARPAGLPDPGPRRGAGPRRADRDRQQLQGRPVHLDPRQRRAGARARRGARCTSSPTRRPTTTARRVAQIEGAASLPGDLARPGSDLALHPLGHGPGRAPRGILGPGLAAPGGARGRDGLARAAASSRRRSGCWSAPPCPRCWWRWPSSATPRRRSCSPRRISRPRWRRRSERGISRYRSEWAQRHGSAAPPPGDPGTP